MADDTDSFPSSSIPKFRVGQLVRFYDHNYKRNVTDIVTFCVRPLGYNVYTVKPRRGAELGGSKHGPPGGHRQSNLNKSSPSLLMTIFFLKLLKKLVTNIRSYEILTPPIGIIK